MAIFMLAEKTTETQRMAFQKVFLKDPMSLALSDSYRTPTDEIHAKRGEVRKLAKELIDKAEKANRNLSDGEIAAFDVCTALLEDFQEAIERKELHAEAVHSIQNNGGNMSTGKSVEYWETETGEKIPVLSKDDRFQDFVAKPQNNAMTSKEFFGAIAGHARTGEIRAQMSENFDTNGGYMVPPHIIAEVIDLLRAKNTVVQAGATTIPLPSPNCRICKIDADPVAAWVPENGTIPKDTSMLIGAIEFNAKKLTCLIKASRELLMDAGNAGSTIMNSIATAMALELDSAVLLGDGTGKPLGIFNTADICSYTYTTNGAQLRAYDDILYGVREIVTANGPLPTTAIMHPRTLVGYSLLKDGDGLPLVKPDLISGMQFLDTTKIPTTQKQGSSNDCTSIILGTFKHLVIGIRATLDIQILNELYADSGQVGFLATMRADTAVYQPKAFCKVTGVRP